MASTITAFSVSAPAAAAENGCRILGLKCAIVLALLSFIVYAIAVLTVSQVRDSPFCCESAGVAAAVSNIKYGAPLGSYYSGVADYYGRRSSEPLSRLLEDSTDASNGLPAAAPGKLTSTVRDGNGVGYPLFVTAAFRLFGIHAWALQVGTLLLMALSASIFLWQFHDDASAIIVTLYFGALTVMLFLGTTWDPSINIQVTVGGVRYFSLIAALPFFHILRALREREAAEAGIPKPVLLALVVQSQILMLVILTRGTAICLGAGIVLAWMLFAWRRRRSSRLLRRLFRKISVLVIASVTSLVLIAIVVSPDYVAEGRFGPTVWERVIAGMGADPKWPFPGVSEMFNCREQIPAGIVPGNTDDNAHCIWFAYAAKNQMSAEASGEQINGSLYEETLRQAFFVIAARYPADVITTFVFYKPMRVYRSITRVLRFNFRGDQSLAREPNGSAAVAYGPGEICLLMGALIVLLLELLVIVPQAPRQMAGLTIYAALCNLPAYFVAYPSPPTIIDLLLYVLLCAGLALSAAVVWIRCRLRPPLHAALSQAE